MQNAYLVHLLKQHVISARGIELPVTSRQHLYIFILVKIVNIFSYFSMKIYVVDTHQKRLAEALLMSTHNLHFLEERRRISKISTVFTICIRTDRPEQTV